jgi:hypothetical protein
LDGVIVQGEIDVIRRAEEEEERKRKRLLSGSSAENGGGAGSGGDGTGGVQTEGSSSAQGTKGKLELDEAESDAMKPVDETLQPLSALEGKGGDGEEGDGDGDITSGKTPMVNYPVLTGTKGLLIRLTLISPVPSGPLTRINQYEQYLTRCTNN